MTYKPEIDGLRAVAVLGVLLFHFDISGFDGGFVGVDVFFVLSGYLICGLLLRELKNEGKVDLIDFWSRRMRRLAPSALVVIVATLFLGTYFLSSRELELTAYDAIFSSVYLINWSKLSNAIAYFDSQTFHSPLLHYWSLAIEEQFYILVTLFILMINQLSKYQILKKQDTALFGLVLILATLLSLVVNFFAIEKSQPEAFFGTHARIWQLGIGGVLAIIELYKFRLPSGCNGISATLGLLGIIGCILLFDQSTPYPGGLALLPTGATILLITAGINNQDRGDIRSYQFLSTAPLIAIGKISYSLYLWHWPIIVYVKKTQNSWQLKEILFAAVATVTISILSYFLVEKPTRLLGREKSTRASQMITLSLFASICVASTSLWVFQQSIAQQLITLPSGKTLRSIDIKNDKSDLYHLTSPDEGNCHRTQKTSLASPCYFGNPNWKETLHLFGDSHAAQWFPALEKISTKNKLRLVTHTKSACAPIDFPPFHKKWNREYHECIDWREATIRSMEEKPPNTILITMKSSYSPLESSGKERLVILRKAEVTTILRLAATGSRIVVLKDTPKFREDPLQCLVGGNNVTERCIATNVNPVTNTFPWATNEYEKLKNISVIEMNDLLCQDNMCPLADENRVRFYDRHHITNTFSRYLADSLEQRLGQL